MDELSSFKDKLIKDIQKNTNPTYIVLLKWINRTIKTPNYVSIFILGLLFYLIGLFFAFMDSTNSSIYTNFWLRTNASGIIVGVLLFLNVTYNKAILTVDEFYSLCKTKSQLKKLHKYYRLMFDVRLQLYAGFSMVIIGLVCFHILGLPFGLTLNLWFYFTAAFIFFFLMQGVYLMISLVIFIYQFSQGDIDYKLNILNPSITNGLKEMANIASVFAIYTLGGALLFLVGLIFADWVNKSTVGTIIQLFWTILLIFYIIFNFIFPHICMKNVIINSKRLSSKKIMEIMRKKSYEKDLDKLMELDEIYSKLTKSRNYALDLTIIAQFLSALVVPIIILLFENPDILNKVIEVIGNFFGKFL